MTLTLILMRHAKSAWDDPLLDDIDRTLNARGRASAPAIAKWLVGNGNLPDTVLVSSARRTIETWEWMAPLMPGTTTTQNTEALYLAGPDVILNVLGRQSARSVMVVCHNPGIARFAEMIAANPPEHQGFNTFPTAATAVIKFHRQTWADIGWGEGRLMEFTVPRDLTD